MKRAARSLWLAALLAATQAHADEMVSAEAGVLRWLDKLTGQTEDVELGRGESATWGRLSIQMDDCRYPKGNPASDAIAHLTIRDSEVEAPVFSGWMVASSPALSALDHPRYDVWVLSCVYPESEAPPEAPPEDPEGAEEPAQTNEG
ncbi:DUF2155 domain-containing protein [Neotabrizicola shimadae]|uniref:DUF2155 domain-containing protein n=1 Tax=Neotabrizicola shimadae TaxID=2807096 RepID=A0A8G1ED67_9RHOB|nr:DUF2155 domain-containing protein [Neotabrizicola shimadae]QYZ71350.1 DUF2155 domain-containing protein [Neotabrizicola shimadae]